MNYHDMMRTVAGRTGLTRRGADEAVLGTLTVLAETVSADETRDLLAQLPKSIQERVPVSGERIGMRPIEFVARVADLNENASLEDTEAQVRAVFATLTEAVNRGEMNDIADELGADFDDLLGRSPRARKPEPQPTPEPVSEAPMPAASAREAAVPLADPVTSATEDLAPGLTADPESTTPVHQPLPATVVSTAVHAAAAVPRVLFALVRVPVTAAVRARPFARR